MFVFDNADTLLQDPRDRWYILGQLSGPVSQRLPGFLIPFRNSMKRIRVLAQSLVVDPLAVCTEKHSGDLMRKTKERKGQKKKIGRRHGCLEVYFIYRGM
jgi:hypothetical protein